MKHWTTIAMLFAAFCLTGCVASDDELLVGKWTLNRATEKLIVTTGDTVVNDLEGYVGQTMELWEDGLCRRVDRTETWVGMWYVSSNRHLVFTDTLSMEVRDDYTIGTLTKERLVCGTKYNRMDTVSGESTRYVYIFEYEKK